MQHTTKYNFNLIETSDPFGPEALNDNARKLETALTDHESTVDGALRSQQSAWQAADAANKSELEQALADQKSALEAADAANKSELQSSISSVDSRVSSTSSSLSSLQSTVSGHTGSSTLHAFIKLGSVNATSGGSSYTVSSPSTYALLMLDVNVSSYGEVNMQINGLSSASLDLTPAAKAIHAVAYLFPASCGVGCMTHYMLDNSSNVSGAAMYSSALTWSGLKTLKFSGKTAKITIYGIKA